MIFNVIENFRKTMKTDIKNVFFKIRQMGLYSLFPNYVLFKIGRYLDGFFMNAFMQLIGPIFGFATRDYLLLIDQLPHVEVYCLAGKAQFSCSKRYEILIMARGNTLQKKLANF